MKHTEEFALMILGAAEETARGAGVLEPWAWYGSHMIGQRMIVVVSADEVGTFPTWPGDLTTEDPSEAQEWLMLEPEQEVLGVPPERAASPQDGEPDPPQHSPWVSTMIWPIREWVQYIREFAGVQPDLSELSRTPDHSFVEVRPKRLTKVDEVEGGEWGLCSCGRLIHKVLPPACPMDIGCEREERDGI